MPAPDACTIGQHDWQLSRGHFALARPDYAGKPHVRSYEGKSRMAELLDHLRPLILPLEYQPIQGAVWSYTRGHLQRSSTPSI